MKSLRTIVFQVYTESDQIRKEDEASGILAELKHWKKMFAKFSSITEEMKGTKFKTVHGTDK